MKSRNSASKHSITTEESFGGIHEKDAVGQRPSLAGSQAFTERPKSLVGKSGTRLNVQLIIQPPDRRRRDESNMVERCKSFYDGIADALGFDDCLFHHREQVWLNPKKPGTIVIAIDWEEE